jgi:ZIP family zinc transporter
MNNPLATALLFSTLAGLSTILGSVVTVFLFKPGPRFMSLTMGFSAGVMILISFGELLQESVAQAGFVPAYLAFFAGMGMMFLIDVLIPHIHMGETHDAAGVVVEDRAPEPENRDEGGEQHGWRHRLRHRLRHGAGYRRMTQGKLLRTGLLVALGIGIHNLPEGITTFVGTMHDTSLGLLIAVAIALHNIPEGISVSAPVFAATGKRGKALAWSALSGLAEPVGALLAAAFLLPFLNPMVMGIVLAAVAGIMVFISLDELIPVACSYCQEHLSILGVISGMVVMTISLGLLRA